MQLDSNVAAIDTDFINHVVECKIGVDKVTDCLKTIFAELGLNVVIHPLVYDNELSLTKPGVKQLFDEYIIIRIDFQDILENNDNKKQYYIRLIGELYYRINGEECPFVGDDALIKWMHDHSLGEIHSLAMCLVCGCGYFLSDDKDSKKLQAFISNYMGTGINVYSRKELVDKHLAEGSTHLNKRVRKSLVHSRCD